MLSIRVRHNQRGTGLTVKKFRFVLLLSFLLSLLLLPARSSGDVINPTTCVATSEVEQPPSCQLLMTTIGQPYTFDFTTHHLVITPRTINPNGDIITVTAHDVSVVAATPFTGTPVIYDDGAGKNYEVNCQDTSAGTDCEKGFYDIETFFFPQQTVQNPGFFWFHGTGFLPTFPSPGWTKNIITSFSNLEVDPVKGRGGPGYSGFQVFQGVTYGNADLAIAVIPTSETETNENLRYTIPVANFGPDTAYAVTVTDTVPDGTNFVSATFQNISCVTFPCEISPKIPCDINGVVVSCNVSPIPRVTLFHPSGAIVELVVKVTATSGKIKNTANVQSALNFDARLGNNTFTATTTIGRHH